MTPRPGTWPDGGRGDLDAIDERIRQASAGPWEPSPKASDAVIAPNDRRMPAWSDPHNDYGGPVVAESMLPADREFVVHARTDLPVLSRELRAARAVIAARRHGTAADVERALDAYDEAVARPERERAAGQATKAGRG